MVVPSPLSTVFILRSCVERGSNPDAQMKFSSGGGGLMPSGGGGGGGGDGGGYWIPLLRNAESITLGLIMFDPSRSGEHASSF